MSTGSLFGFVGGAGAFVVTRFTALAAVVACLRARCDVVTVVSALGARHIGCLRELVGVWSDFYFSLTLHLFLSPVSAHSVILLIFGENSRDDLQTGATFFFFFLSILLNSYNSES